MPPPTADRLKVRCYRCNQLLAVAPNKAGTVVSCPKCKAELLIPRPEPQPIEDPSDTSVPSLKSDTFPALSPVPGSPDAPARAGDAPAPRYLDEIAALIPPELAALRPEDLRVEAEVFGAIARQPGPPPPVAEAFSFPGTLSGSGFTPAPAAEPEPAPAPAPAPGATIPPSTPGPVEAPPPLPIPIPAPPAETNVVIPPIRFEVDPIRPGPDAEPRSIREVVLPASVVLAWSLFVLSAIPMAFLAGLFIGHFLWKAGP